MLPLIDRKFFREQYNQEQILSGLIEEVKRFDSVPEMSRLVSRKVESALHPQRIYLFYRGDENRDLSLGYSSEGVSQGLRIPEEFRILRVLEGQVGTQDFPFPQKNILPSVEEEWLAALGTRLIVPLVGTDHRLAGLFLLGDKKSEVPYTANDRNLLESLASQVALVYENAQLKDRVDHERKIKQAVLGRFEYRRALGRLIADDAQHFGNHIASTAHRDFVADTNIFAAHFVFVMQGGIGHCDAANEHWF